MSDEIKEINLESPEIQQAIQERVDAQVAGLKSKNGELIAKHNAMRDELQAFRGQFEGLDIDAVKGLLQRVGEDEETKLIAEGKTDEVVSRRTERMRAEYDKQLKEQAEKLESYRGFANKFRERVLSDAIRDAAVKAGCLPTACDDVILRGRMMFEVTDDGEAVAMRDGDVVLGKDGIKPLSPAEWVESLRDSAPHLWPKAVGGSATGSGGEATKNFNDLSEADRVELYRSNPDRYRQLRDAANKS